jgi:hypothetical protein
MSREFNGITWLLEYEYHFYGSMNIKMHLQMLGDQSVPQSDEL